MAHEVPRLGASPGLLASQRACQAQSIAATVARTGYLVGGSRNICSGPEFLAPRISLMFLSSELPLTQKSDARATVPALEPMNFPRGEERRGEVVVGDFICLLGTLAGCRPGDVRRIGNRGRDHSPVRTAGVGFSTAWLSEPRQVALPQPVRPGSVLRCALRLAGAHSALVRSK
jgi:hypothetical protein